ncbi:MAG: thiolase family protein [Deltaproteobacteria bacterium]|nr:thiolase family protein [Deltaproteobacteria bacterium]
MKDVVILSAVRTPIGGFLGAFKDISAPQLAAHCVRTSVERSGIEPAIIDECILGCVLSAGLGQAPARQAALFGGLPNSVRCTTINRVCGSGLKSVMLASQAIQCGDADMIVAGGMENMSRTPFLLERAREGYRMGHGQIVDSMIHDGLWEVYRNYHMGHAAELCAREKKIDRVAQDQFAASSYQRALESIKTGKFRNEIVGVEIAVRKEKKIIDTDEEPFKAKLDRMGELKPVFDKAGTVTAANASSLSDGASCLVVASQATCEKRGLKPIARLIGQATFAQEPEWFTTAPVGCIRKLVEKTGIALSQVDLFEINEAFSVVALACMKELGLREDRLNIRGGAVALGHPIGASGARILTTLIHALRAENKRYGIASICNGGGEASAVLVEAL